MFRKQVKENKSLAERSADAISIFRTTSDSLIEINEEANLAIEVNQQQIDALEQENAGYKEMISSNNSVVKNIEKILK